MSVVYPGDGNFYDLASGQKLSPGEASSALQEQPDNAQWTKVVQVTEADWIQMQVAIAELKSRVHDLELQLKNVDSNVQQLIVDAGY